MKTYEFGPFRLEPSERLLRREGTPLPLTPKAFDTLMVLVGNSGRAVGKDELMEKVWPGVSVTEATLAQNVFALRKALGDARHIETVPKFGYRFAAPVREMPARTGHLVVAVLPFSSLGTEDYFGEALGGELVTQLGRLNPERIRVIARSSATRFKESGKTAADFGRELGAAFVVEGAVRRAGGQVRIDVQVIDTAEHTQVWAESYDRAADDLMVLQRDLAHAVAREIGVTLAPGRLPSIAPASPASREAHEAYLKGRYFWNRRTEDALKKGIALFEEAIQRDPRSAAAYDGLSDSYVMLACRGVLPARETLRKAREAAAQALSLDPWLGEAHATLAHVRLHELDWSGLDEDFRRAIDLSPSHTFTYYWYAEYLLAMGRADEAVAMVTRAREMDPVSGSVNASLGMILYLARRYRESIDCLRAFLELEADHYLVHLRLGLSYIQIGEVARAVEEMRRAVTLSGRATEAIAGLAQALAAAGLHEEMQTVIGELRAEAAKRYVAPYNLAKVYAAAGDAGAAFDQLNAAYDERYPDLIEVRSDPAFDPLRGDPRFSALLRKIGWPS